MSQAEFIWKWCLTFHMWSFNFCLLSSWVSHGDNGIFHIIFNSYSDWKAFHSIASIENHFITSCHSFMGFAFHSQGEGEQTNLQSWTQISKNCPTFDLGPATLAIHPSVRAMLGRPSRALVPLVWFGLFIIRTKVLNVVLSPYRQRYSLGLGCTRSQSHL